MIRTATERDLDSVLKIEKLSFSIPWSLTSFRKKLNEIFLVEDKVGGFLIAECYQRNFYMAAIKRLAVHPEQRRIGIGSALLDTALEILKHRGIQLVMLSVESSRRPAIRLYTKFNFRVTYSSFCHASILFAMDSRASAFFTMELQMKKKKISAPHSPLKENPKRNLNGILPPFKVEGRYGVTCDGMPWW